MDRKCREEFAMKIEVLLSCMHQENTDIVTKSNITTDVLIVNQTNFESKNTYINQNQTIHLYNTIERGLSNSRNMALENATGDICLLCDDDEILEDGYESIILEAFRMLPDAAVIAFDVKNKVTRLKPRVKKIGYLDSLKLASYQLAINRKRILDSSVRFDPVLGAGTGNGAGEENKFLLDCIKEHLSVYFVPQIIGEVCHGESTWFFGFDEKFFYQRGMTTRYIFGRFWAIVYGAYYVIMKHSLYKNDISIFRAWKSLMQGISENRLG